MKLDMHLKVDAQSFFDCLVDSIVYDINSESNKTVEAKDLKKGFTYKKKMKTKTKAIADVKVKFTQFQPPYHYSAEFKSNDGTTKVSYDIEDSDNGGIDLHYSEDFESKSHFNSWNYKLVTFIYTHKAKKKMKQTFRRMESFILKEQRDTTKE